MKNKPKFYQVIGWYPNIRPEARNSRNISDGAYLSSREEAEKYVKRHNIHLMRITKHELEVDKLPENIVKHIEYCEQSNPITR